MKRRFLWGILCLLLVLSFAATAWSQELPETYPIMRPDKETLERWIQDYESAPEAYIDEELRMRIAPQGSRDLLSYLQYTPSQRNQGSCGNCWVWAGTGVIGIDLNVNQSIKDRLSVQYIDSCETSSYACCGGWLSDVADFYTSNPQALPWSNTNASWQDGSRTCSLGSSLVSCGTIATSPKYLITSINDTSITTHGVSETTAIANIKNILHQNKAISFSFFLANNSDWDAFRDFWSNQNENAIWDIRPARFF